jgi:hypothetical protein
MTYSPIPIDKERLTLMGVPFPDLKTLEAVASGIGSNMFEGMQPTRKKIEIIRDGYLGKISDKEAIKSLTGIEL